jgi:serine protease
LFLPKSSAPYFTRLSVLNKDTIMNSFAPQATRLFGSIAPSADLLQASGTFQEQIHSLGDLHHLMRGTVRSSAGYSDPDSLPAEWRGNAAGSSVGLGGFDVSPSPAASAGVGVSIADFIGNDLRTAYNIGDVNNAGFSWGDSVNSGDRYDFYRFRLDNAATVNLGLTGMSADSDLYLLDSAGNTITSSTAGGATNEAISRYLGAGVYYARVQSFGGSSTNYNFSLNAAGPARDPGSSVGTAHDLGNISRSYRNWNDYAGSSDTNDYYRFELTENGNFHLTLNGLSSDLDVSLLDGSGNFITASTRVGTATETIDRFLQAGTYYARVYPWSGSSSYSLGVSTDTPSYFGTRTLTGTLGADTFDFTGNYARTVVSGNGDVDFGSGLRDVLDLSGLLSSNVSFNYANTSGGGVLYNTGNGTRVFDSITLNDGRQILFEGIDRIRFADTTINLSVTPNDPLFNQQWNLHMMGLQSAWRFTTGASNVMVGVEDTGLGVSGGIHYDLRSTTIYGNNYADDYKRGTSTKTTSHGTNVQGIIAANSNNGLGMSGINWNSEVFNIDVLDGNVGDQSLATASQNLINHAAAGGKRLVINMSLGWGETYGSTGIDPAFEAVVAANPNVLFVIAAGNDGDKGISGISYPGALAASYGNVMAVGASWGRTDAYGNAKTPGTRIEYAGWWGSQYGTGLTLMAPSEVIATSATRSAAGAVSFGFDTGFNGTSAATPNATGVASLVWSANSNLSAAQVKQIMAQTAVDLGAAGYDTLTGSGMVNADAAVRRAMAIARGAVV